MKKLSEFNSKTNYVDILISCGDEVLYLRRANYLKFNRGKWCIPGGSIDKNEDALEAVIRETKEETGIIISNPKFLFKHEYDNGKSTSVFHIELNEKPEVKISKEHAQFKWLTYKQVEEIKEKFPPETIEIITKFINTI